MAISNGISFNNGASSIGLVGDLRLAQILSMEIKLLLTDTANLRNSPFIDYGWDRDWETKYRLK